MFFLCTRLIHPSRPLGYLAPVASNTPSQYPDSIPTQFSTLYPTQTALPPTQYHALPAPQYQSSPFAPYPASFTAHGDTSLASPVPMSLAMSLLNHCHLSLDRGRRSLSHSAPTRTWHVRLCSTHIPTLRTNPPPHQPPCSAHPHATSSTLSCRPLLCNPILPPRTFSAAHPELPA